MAPFELIICIVNFGQGTKVVRAAERSGVNGGTICLGHGTVKNRFLEFLDICDVRKEIVIMLTDCETAKAALQKLNKDLALAKPNHGIAFTMSVESLFGSRVEQINQNYEYSGSANMYKAIFTIVEKGMGEEVIDVAKKCGARGATLINARGSGVNETQTFFAMEIEPEKEMVLIIAGNDIKDGIVATVKRELKIDEPGKGIIFVMDINEVCGLC